MQRCRSRVARGEHFCRVVVAADFEEPEINSPNGPRRAGAERAAINAPMQGTAADIIKKAMITVDAWLRQSDTGAEIIMQVHDELVLEVPTQALAAVQQNVSRLMAAAADLRVPLKVDVGHGANWDEAH